MSFHNGIRNEFVKRLCINRGTVNPKTGRPDSFCGKVFLDPKTCGKKYQEDTAACKYHEGFLEFIDEERTQLAWNCCKIEYDPEEAEPTYCAESAHRHVKWPDLEAKVYFIKKPVDNPGVKEDTIKPLYWYQIEKKRKPKKKGAQETDDYIFYHQRLATSDFFKTIIPYEEVDHQKYKKLRKTLENETRYCLNWTCEQEFKDSSNHPRACRSHPGVWDFGHSGFIVSKSGQQTKQVLWPPHWRCCGGEWTQQGCEMTFHKGPLLSALGERKWKWPSEGAKRYFDRQVSKLWQSKLESEILSKRQVEKGYDAFCKETGASIVPTHMLHKLCLKLHLHILCVSEDLSYLFKYQDLISKQAEKMLDNGRGQIDKDAQVFIFSFVRWWFAPLEEIRPEMADPNPGAKK